MAETKKKKVIKVKVTANDAETFQIVSDLHLEFLDGKFPPLKKKGTFLVLLGDICCVAADNDYAMLLSFLQAHTAHYKAIIYVAGNHEFYYRQNKVNVCAEAQTMQGCIARLSSVAKLIKNFVFLNNRSVILQIGGKKHMIIGSTLWTNIPPASQPAVLDLMSDYGNIYVNAETKTRKLHPSDVTAMHLRCYKYIASRIAIAKKEHMNVIVFTHHKPYLEEEDVKDERYVCYGSDCTKLFGDNVVLWAYGHTHVADDRIIKGTRLYSNPKGYPRQKTNYDPAKVVTV